MKCRSEWHSPATRVRIRTSRGPGFGTLTSSITSGWFTSCRTAAFIGFPPFLSYVVDMQSARSLSNGERAGVRGYALSLGPDPSPGSKTIRPLPPGEVKTLIRKKQFANLRHADVAVAEQMARDRARCSTFREPERVACRNAMVDPHSRQQQPFGVAAHRVN